MFFNNSERSCIGRTKSKKLYTIYDQNIRSHSPTRGHQLGKGLGTYCNGWSQMEKTVRADCKIES